MAASLVCHLWSPHADYSASLGDQPFAAGTLFTCVARPSTANAPRGLWSESMFGSDSLMSYPGQGITLSEINTSETLIKNLQSQNYCFLRQDVI